MSPPLALTTEAEVLGSYAIDFKGLVNPNGEVTTYKFEYDIDINFGTSAFSSIFNLNADMDYTSVNIPVQNLIANTDYFYRVIATNGSGSATGLTLLTKTRPVAVTLPQLDLGSRTLTAQKISPLWRDFNQFNPDKKPFIYNVEVVAQGLNNIFTCAKRAMFFKNSFGSTLDKIPFDPNDNATIDLIRAVVIEDSAQEPRVFIDNTNTSFTPFYDENQLDIDLVFGLHTNNARLFQTNINNISLKGNS